MWDKLLRQLLLIITLIGGVHIAVWAVTDTNQPSNLFYNLAAAQPKPTPDQLKPAPAQPAAPTPKPSKVPPLPDLVIGQDNAPITVIIYSSLTCPHCAEFHLTTIPALKAKYVNPGTMKIILRDYPDDALALKVTMLSRCGRNLTQCLQLRDELLKLQRHWLLVKYPQDPLIEASRIVRAQGIGDAEVRSCLNSMQLGEQIMQVVVNGYHNYKIAATPFFVINDKPYPQMLTLEDFEKIVAAYVNTQSAAKGKTPPKS